MAQPARSARFRGLFFTLLLATQTAVLGAQAAPTGSVAGTVRDPLDVRIPAAAVTLVQDGKTVADTTSDAQGQYSFAAVGAGRYRVEVKAQGFEPQTSRSFFVGLGHRAVVDVPLPIGLKQDVVVTASATEESAAQIGAPVTVIDRQVLDDLAKPAVLEALRLVPGSQVVQTGGRGGATSFFVRGGNPNFNKVLIDGVPVNDVGGAFNYADLTLAGIDRVEALRDANSVLYGSDAMAGVVSLTTRRGQTRTPELTAALDGGSLGTHHEDVSLGGTHQRFDYFGAYSHFTTDNKVPNNAYTNDTVAARVGYALGGSGDVSATVRHISRDYGVPNAFDLYGVADDSTQSGASTYVGLNAQTQLTPAWHLSLHVTSFDDHSEYRNPSPTGEAFDPFGFGANYLGQTVTVRGANGTQATGRAILDYGGTYPQTFPSEARRRAAFGQTTYQVAPALALSLGARYEHEEAESGATTRSTTKRDNAGAFVEARAKVRRFYATGGLGYEHNEVFGTAWTPRLSAAFYLREPSLTETFGDTKLVFNIGRGIKAPNLSQEASSLFTLLAAAPSVTAAVDPMGPERNRSLDAGVEQGLWRGQVRLRATWFDNRYSDLIEFLSKPALVRLGVPAEAAAATAFGAYVNSSSYRARGVETSLEASLGRNVRVLASYTYLDAKVSASFSSSALGPVENPAYPGVAIGAYGPLVGARPFRRPVHSGSFLATYTRGPAQVSLAGALAGKSDDSTFLSDQFFGNSLLLPNHDLNGGYRKIDASGSYGLARSRVRLYASVENLLDRHDTPSFGFPTLPRTFRVGVRGTLGGDGGRH
jgi:iron complex outermembrane receptor protein/vitamin B12 transporter